jgi:Zn-finger protein
MAGALPACLPVWVSAVRCVFCMCAPFLPLSAEAMPWRVVLRCRGKVWQNWGIGRYTI